MTIRFNENDANVSNGIVQLTADGKLPALNGSLLTNLPTTPTTLNNNFDAYQVVVQSTDDTIADGKLYMITASCKMTFPSGSNGNRCAFIITNDTAVLTLEANISSGGTALRFCIDGSCYGNQPANTTLGSLVFSTTKTFSGKGKCLEFIRVSDGIAGAWFEKNHQQILETGGGTNYNGNWANFQIGLGTNAATGYANKYTLAHDGSYFRWRTLGQDTTSLNAANGGTLAITVPTNHQYMDQLIYFIGLTTGTWTSGYTINLAALSSLSREFIHMKRVFIVLRDAVAALTYNQAAVNTYPYYLIRFSDTNSGVTFQQKWNFNTNGDNPIAPYTKVSNVGIQDYLWQSTTSHQLTNAGVVITYNWDLKRWYRITDLSRG